MKRSDPDASATAIEKIYDDLAKQGFEKKTITQLNDSRILEDTIWQEYGPGSSTSTSVLIFLLLDNKRLGQQKTLEALPVSSGSDDHRISKLVGDALQVSLDDKQSYRIRSISLSFLTDAVLSLDLSDVQRAIQPLVSILIWQHLIPTFREELFLANPILRKRYKARLKAFNLTDDNATSRLKSDSVYVCSLVENLFEQLDTTRSDVDTLQYCSRVLEFLSVLLAQLPTRRYTLCLLQDLQVMTRIRLSFRFNQQDYPSLLVFKAHLDLLDYYLNFPYDNMNGRELAAKEMRDQAAFRVSALQHIAFSDFKDNLILLALSNHSTITNRAEMASHLEGVSKHELINLCARLNMRTFDDRTDTTKDFEENYLRAALTERYASTTPTADLITSISTLPTELNLFSPLHNALASLSDHNPLPKLTLQYLSINDFLYRSLQQLRSIAFQSIRIDIINVLARLSPQIVYPSREIKYNGTSNNALMIEAPTIMEATPPRIGKAGHPGLVRAEVVLDLDELNPETRRGWTSLKTGDILYFLSLTASDDTSTSMPSIEDSDFANKIGLKYVRCATIEAVLAADGKPLHTIQQDSIYETDLSRKRMLRLLLDPIAFQADKNAGALEAVYENLNVLIKRKHSKDRFLPIMEGVQRAATRVTEPIPSWLLDSMTGFGEPTESIVSSSIDLHNTFIDRAHAEEVFQSPTPMGQAQPTHEALTEQDLSKKTNADLQAMLAERNLATKGKKAELVARLCENAASLLAANDFPTASSANVIESFSLQLTPSIPTGSAAPSKKRKRHESTLNDFTLTSQLKNPSGPYIHNRQKCSNIRFSRSQVTGILAATSSGLTLIEGPAGSGKTDVAAQSINNVYFNEPDNRSLIVCKNEQCLESLTTRVMRSNVDSIHILKLRAGSDTNDEDFSGITGILAQKGVLLSEVTRLASVLGVPGDHGASCETAAYFFETTVRSIIAAWLKDASVNDFHKFFDNAPLDDKLSVEQKKMACLNYVDNIFERLAEIRPLELLRSAKARHKFVLTKLAKVILTTAEHIATAQATLAEAEITCHTIIITQASAMTELEAFFPFSIMQNSSAIKRFVLFGDTQQISPSSNDQTSIEISCKSNQSLFSRLKRSGIQPVMLMEQGRCRANIAALYAHRYPNLSTLPSATISEYTRANAGISRVAQFIDVPDYKGQGEFSRRAGTWQNLGEAEYVVALYQYMRLLNYPSAKITLLTIFDGQKALILDILNTRCRNPMFGIPCVATVAEYQGQENDHVLLSLVRTRSGPELHNLELLTTALSRARLGLYVFGRRAAMPRDAESFMKHLNVIDDGKLQLVSGEMYPTSRLQEDLGQNIAIMAGVEHLGKYVYQMTQKKVEMSSA